MQRRRLLEGLRVLDFCWLAAGPMATRVLSNFGAEVLKVESSTRIDALRFSAARAPGREGFNAAHIFNNINVGKLSIVLNLNHPRAIDIVKHLVSVSDVVTNNFTADRMNRWGLGYSELKHVKPDIIYL